MNEPLEHTVEIQVSQGTVEKLHRIALTWGCSVDEALDKIVAMAQEADS